MKRFAIFALLLLISIPNANAALIARPLKQFAQVDPASVGVVANKESILVFGNREKSGFAQLINSQPIDLACGIESFASAATTDSDGNFYIVGAASNPIVGTLPPINGILNPDNVAPDPVSSNKSDANNLCLWKLDPTGKLIESNSLPMNSVIIPNAILVDKYGVTIAGTIYNNPGFSGFMMNWNSPAFILGKSSTQVFSMARTSEGSTVLVGQSSEKLLDKPLKGKSDGFLAKITNGKLSSIQRSSDTKANRAWKSTTSNLILGGFSNSSAVVTKFATNFTPTWTSRYPGIGSAYTATSGRESFAAFVSNGPIKALVQENETSANVKAIKKIPSSPPLSLLASILFTKREGNTISKAPKNENAKTSNIRKKKRLNHTLVLIACNASIPNITVNRMPRVV